MTVRRLVIPPGVHELEEAIQDVHIVGFEGNLRLAKLELTVRSPQSSETKSPAATTVAIHLEQAAAMHLLLALHQLSNELGWPLEQAISGQGLGQSSVGEMQPGRKRPK